MLKSSGSSYLIGGPKVKKFCFRVLFYNCRKGANSRCLCYELPEEAFLRQREADRILKHTIARTTERCQRPSSQNTQKEFFGRWVMGTATPTSMLLGISQQRNMRSKFRWFTVICKSHYVSHFAAFFIVVGAKTSVAESYFHLVLWNEKGKPKWIGSRHISGCWKLREAGGF